MDWNLAERAINVVCRKRTLDVMALQAGVKGHNELARETELDNKCLSRVLHHMRRAGLVQRSVLSSSPSLRVHYALTPRAQELISLLDALARWQSERRCHEKDSERELMAVGAGCGRPHRARSSI